jgi:hypothetical protein
MLEIAYPMLFELCNPITGHVSHRGVLEFTAEEGFITTVDDGELETRERKRCTDKEC